MGKLDDLSLSARCSIRFEMRIGYLHLMKRFAGGDNVSLYLHSIHIAERIREKWDDFLMNWWTHAHLINLKLQLGLTSDGAPTFCCSYQNFFSTSTLVLLLGWCKSEISISPRILLESHESVSRSPISGQQVMCFSHRWKSTSISPRVVRRDWVDFRTTEEQQCVQLCASSNNFFNCHRWSASDACLSTCLIFFSAAAAGDTSQYIPVVVAMHISATGWNNILRACGGGFAEVVDNRQWRGNKSLCSI